VIGEYGQINSAFSDNRIMINQSMSFPTVYSNQKSVLREEWKSGVLNVAVKELELKKQVSQVFFSILYLQNKKKLLQQNDSLYADFLTKANLRFAAGESNILEKSTAELQRGQIAIQLNQLTADLELLQLQFQLLLNSETTFVPQATDFKLSTITPVDTSFVSSHPSIRLLEQQKILSLRNAQLEKSRLLPDFILGYNSMTIRGTGADNVVYDGSTRFQSGQIGVGIPLFYGSQRAKIYASKSMLRLSDANYQWGKQQLSIEYKKAVSQYSNLAKAVAYYEQTGLKNAEQISETANQQFANGGINYLEWVMLTNQAIAIRTEYLNTVNNLNESIIQLNYFLNK
jgi:cobalt-zinc-cadmium resistance protein CzcA